MFGDGKDVLVAAPTHVHADDVIARQARRDLHHMGERMGRFERGDDVLGRTRQLERLERFLVGDRHILRAADFVQPCMLRPDTGLIETGGDREASRLQPGTTSSTNPRLQMPSSKARFTMPVGSNSTDTPCGDQLAPTKKLTKAARPDIENHRYAATSLR